MANVIVVDDDADIRGVVRRVVERDGHVVREAPDGREALRLMREAIAGLIIADVYMPVMDGIETLIRMQHDFPAARIVIMSGGGNLKAKDLLEIASTLGARAVLEKPMTDAAVRAAVAKALG